MPIGTKGTAKTHHNSADPTPAYQYEHSMTHALYMPRAHSGHMRDLRSLSKCSSLSTAWMWQPQAGWMDGGWLIKRIRFPATLSDTTIVAGPFIRYVTRLLVMSFQPVSYPRDI